VPQCTSLYYFHRNKNTRQFHSLRGDSSTFNDLIKYVTYKQVEKIVAKRKRQGKVEFLIKWRGYKSDENSWEPEEHLVGCSNVIREYNKNEKEMKISFSKTRVR
jgi:hypothetical protein